jgi:MurNAc alpha-1-phosphate uridylyltransferase
MGTLTASTPKPLLRVGGRTLLDHAIAHVRAAKADPMVVNAHYLGQQIVAHCAEMPDVRVVEEDSLLDTGGGLKAALPLLAPAPILTMNADAIFANGAQPVARLMSAWRAGMGALMLVSPRAQARAHQGVGDFDIEPGGHLIRRGQRAEAAFVYTGLQLIDPDWVATTPGSVFSLNAVWDRILAQGALYGAVYDGPWIDTGTPEGLAEAEALIRV